MTRQTIHHKVSNTEGLNLDKNNLLILPKDRLLTTKEWSYLLACGLRHSTGEVSYEEWENMAHEFGGEYFVWGWAYCDLFKRQVGVLGAWNAYDPVMPHEGF